jgi:hypothetical protein
LVLGAGVQGRAHLAVLAACGVERVWVHDRHPERSASLAAPPGPGGKGPAVEDNGKYLVVLLRGDDGKWRVARDMDNSDRPATQATRGTG